MDPADVVVVEAIHGSFGALRFPAAVVEGGGEAAGFGFLELKFQLGAAGIAELAEALELGGESGFVFGIEFIALQR